MTRRFFMELGKKIKLLRKLNNLTQHELAKSLYVSYQLVSKWERNISSPTFETLITMTDIYHLPMVFFNSPSTSETQTYEKEKIFTAFTEYMLQPDSDRPTIQTISVTENVTEQMIKKYFNNIDELMYAFIFYTDQQIKLEVKNHIRSNKNILAIFIEDMGPLLYSKRLELNLLYTRPYIKIYWINFITSKYKKILSNHATTIGKNGIELDYAIRILTSFIETWLSQSNPEPLEDFQLRIEKLTTTTINQWPIFNRSV